MKKQGRTIRIHLVDGTANGIRTAEIMNWTGKAVVASRTDLADLAKRDEAKRTGIYCLVGPDPEKTGRTRIYIGEADRVIGRLKDHDSDAKKQFWTSVVLVTSKDENLTKSHGRYLESRLIAIATESRRASLANGTAPEPPRLPEPDVDDMEFFLEQIQMMFPVLGFDFLQPLVEQDPEETVTSPLFVLAKVGAKAEAREIGDQFVLLAGSTARKHGVKSWDAYVSLRDGLVADGRLAERGPPGYYVATEDIPFSSPSAAAAIVRASNCNGRTEWTMEDGKTTYADWSASRLAAATDLDEEE